MKNKMKKQNKPEGWEKEFEERFGARIDWLEGVDSVLGEATEVIKEFIRQLLAQKEKEVKEELKKKVEEQNEKTK